MHSISNNQNNNGIFLNLNFHPNNTKFNFSLICLSIAKPHLDAKLIHSTDISSTVGILYKLFNSSAESHVDSITLFLIFYSWLNCVNFHGI